MKRDAATANTPGAAKNEGGKPRPRRKAKRKPVIPAFAGTAEIRAVS
jgi:hypothetical protein